MRNDKYLISAFRHFQLHLENQPTKKRLKWQSRALSAHLITSLLITATKLIVDPTVALSLLQLDG